MKKLHIALLSLGVAFLGYLLWSIGVSELWQQFKLLGWGLVAFVLLEGAGEFLHTLGWRHVLSGPNRCLSRILLFRIRMAGYAINYLTPTATLGGEVTKVALLTSNATRSEAVSGVLIGKVCFACGHMLFVVAGGVITLWSVHMATALWVVMLLSSGLIATGIITFLLLQKYGKLGTLFRWLVARNIGGRRLQTISHEITEVDEALKNFYRERPWDIGLAVCWHWVGNSVGILQTWLFLSALYPSTSLAMAAGAWFLGAWFDMVTFAVPLNVGVLEGSRVVAFKALGFTALLGMTYGVTLRLAQVFWAGVGLVNYGFLARAAARQAVSPAPASPTASPPSGLLV
jgi:uncharacterized membrane protein YbhN (UPF0104 family)